MTLKETIAGDITTFLNGGEFAEEHTIRYGGVTKTISGVLDEDTLGRPAMNEATGIASAVKRFFCRESDLPAAPVIDKEIEIGVGRYLIRDFSREMGMAVLTLESNG